MLPSTRFRSKAVRSLPMVLAALLFAGCGTRVPDQSAAYMQGQSTANAAFYLQQMQQSTDDSKTNWQLLAIRALLQEGKTPQAIQLFQLLPQNLTDAQRAEQSLLAVELKLIQQDNASAKSLLASIQPASLNPSQLQRYWQAQIALNKGALSIELLRALIAQEPGLQGAEKQKNIDATWQALSSMSTEQIKGLSIQSDEKTLQGWLDLQHMWSENRNDPNMIKAAIKDWQTRYPDNPGAKMLPTQLTSVQTFKPASVNKIALLLPLSGQAALFGQTIEQGFTAAKNAGTSPVSPVTSAPAQPPVAATAPATAAPAPSGTTAPVSASGVASPAAASVADLTASQPPAAAQPQTEAPTAQPQQPDTPAINSAAANPSAELKVYDTSARPLDQILAQAQQDGVSIVVGPLLKEDVQAVMRSNTSLNILALNQPEAVKNQPNICYFALSPEDEAYDAARHIFHEGHKNPLLLIPRNSFGSRVSKAFAQEWKKLGGGIVLAQQFGTVNELKQNINSNTGISLTGSPVQGSLPPQQSVTIGGLTIPKAPAEDEITAGASGNVDAVYIIATQPEIALLKPMIAMRAGSRSGVTLYASSRSSQGGTGPDFRLEMEGVQFSEIPMLSGGNNALMQQALSATHNDYSLARLYAMGVDAWSLASHFSQMRQVPGYQIQGNTGELTANQDCVINRKLPWLVYQQGNIVPVN